MGVDVKIQFCRSGQGVIEYVLTPTTAEDGFQLARLYHKDNRHTRLEPDGLSVRVFFAPKAKETFEAAQEYDRRRHRALMEYRNAVPVGGSYDDVSAPGEPPTQAEIDGCYLPPLEAIEARNAAARAKAAAQGEGDPVSSGGS